MTEQIDMLDEFSAIKTSESQDKCRQSKVRPETVNDEIETTDEAGTEFSKQLQEQMAALMGPGIESPEIKREIEGLMRDLGAAVDPGATQEGSDMPEGGEILQAQLPSSEEPFQETIRRTMERMQASGEQAAAAANSEDADNMMANLLKEVRDSDFNGAGDEEGMNKMLLGMMEELTNKDILYEPMKELHDKFPAWMAQNRDHTEADDLKRYDKQQKLVAEIVGKFEQKGYSDNETGDRAYIVERMQQVSFQIDFSV